MRVLIYANVGLNLIDGSTVWVQSLAEILASLPGCEVTVLSRDMLEDRGVAASLQRIKGLRILCCADYPDILEAFSDPRDPEAIAHVIARIDELETPDRIILRAPEVALRLARKAELRHRLWAYVLESPAMSAQADRGALAEIVEGAGGLIVQSDAQRGLLEAVFPSAVNKTSILPPMVKPVDVPAGATSLNPTAKGVRFIYAGKYSATWNVESFFDVPAACKAAGVEAVVTMIGDKVHNEPDDKGFRGRILMKFKETPGVTWLGAMERDGAITEASHHDLGLCWRTDELNDSLEISTKFLEFASQGVPSVVNRTAAYEVLLGQDYPYFATSMADVVAAAQAVRDNPARHAALRDQVRRLADQFSYETAGRRLAHALRLRPGETRLPAEERVRLLIASHDLKFFHQALHWLEESDRFEISHDRWKSTMAHDAAASEALLDQADVIFCEWCAGNAGWYSKHKRPDQKLFIRLHRFEAFTSMPLDVDISAVDGIIVVSDYLRDYCAKEFGWPLEKMVILPQFCEAEQFRRGKNPGAEKTLGLVGINSFLKRPDLAVEILRRVRREHPEFRLRIRSGMPWDIPWLWAKEEEKSLYTAFFADLEADPETRAAVIFDRPGANMSEWFRNIGYVLSTSDIEGCHTAAAEGMCSGAVPVVINWAGAGSIYGPYVHASVEAMAQAILASLRNPMSAAARETMQDEARDLFDISRTVAQLERWFETGATRRTAILQAERASPEMIQHEGDAA